MAQQNVAMWAALVALAFLALALSACASSEQIAGPANIAPIAAPPAIPEVHGSRIGADTLRSRLGD